MTMASMELIERAKASADALGAAFTELLETPTVVNIGDAASVVDVEARLSRYYRIRSGRTTLFVSPDIVAALPDTPADAAAGMELLSTFARRAWDVVSAQLGAESRGDVQVAEPDNESLGSLIPDSVIAAIIQVGDATIEAFIHENAAEVQAQQDAASSAAQPGRSSAEKLELDELSAQDAMARRAIDLGLLGDVEVNVTVELGRRRIPLNELLKLTRGSIIELEKFVGEPLEVFVNNRLIADGEAVVIDDHFGIRITNVVPSVHRNV